MPAGPGGVSTGEEPGPGPGPCGGPGPGRGGGGRPGAAGSGGGGSGESCPQAAPQRCAQPLRLWGAPWRWSAAAGAAQGSGEAGGSRGARSSTEVGVR